MKLRDKFVYVCGVDWQHEVGETQVITYQSVKAAKKMRCWKQDGIVKLRVSEVKWVHKQELFKDETKMRVKK